MLGLVSAPDQISSSKAHVITPHPRAKADDPQTTRQAEAERHGEGADAVNGARTMSASSLPVATRFGAVMLPTSAPRLGDRVLDLGRNETYLSLALSAARIGTWNWDIASDLRAWCDLSSLIVGAVPSISDLTYQGFIAGFVADDRQILEQREITVQTWPERRELQPTSAPLTCCRSSAADRLRGVGSDGWERSARDRPG